MEEWKKVPYEELQHYEVSTFGNIRLLPREVPTHIVNRGRDMIVVAKRKGKDIKPQYEDGRPLVRMLDSNGNRRKFSLPLLLLKTFKMNECPGDIDDYTAAYLDNDYHNNNIDNLVWISRAALMSSIAITTRGESHKNLVKYENIIIKVNNQIVGYFKNTTEGADLFNSYGIQTSASAIARALKERKQFYFMFDFEPVGIMEYTKVCINYPQINLKMLYDMILEDRRHSRKIQVKKIIKKEIVYKEKVVYKPKIEKQIVYKERIVYRNKKDEKLKEEKKMLDNDSKTNGKKTKDKVLKTAKAKTSRLDYINDLDFYKEQEQLKKDKFKEELLRRLNNS